LHRYRTGQSDSLGYADSIRFVENPASRVDACEKLLQTCEVLIGCRQVSKSSDLARQMRSSEDAGTEIRVRRRVPQGEYHWFCVRPADGTARELAPVEVRDGGNGIAYLRWRVCCAGSSRQIVSLLRAMQNLSGLVVDLRGNPGGHLSEGVFFASQWLRNGKEVLGLAADAESYLAERYCMVFRAEMGQRWDVPVVFITDSQTASTAEAIVAIFKSQLGSISLGGTTRGDALAHMVLAPTPSQESPCQTMLIRVKGFPIYHNKGIAPDCEPNPQPQGSSAAGDMAGDARDPSLRPRPSRRLSQERCLSLARTVLQDRNTRVGRTGAAKP
jgi:C-terminal processing protease CtpA/Prc